MTKHECDSGCQHGASMDIKEDVDEARRSFLKDAVVAGGGVVSAGTLGVTLVSGAHAETGARAAEKSSHSISPHPTRRCTGATSAAR